MSHTASGQTANYIWDVNRGVPEILQDGTNTYVYGIGLISSTDGSGNQTYYTHDGLGSITDLTNSSAVKTDGYTYDAFGMACPRSLVRS
jgi:YD repeat-containing protein